MKRVAGLQNLREVTPRIAPSPPGQDQRHGDIAAVNFHHDDHRASIRRRQARIDAPHRHVTKAFVRPVHDPQTGIGCR